MTEGLEEKTKRGELKRELQISVPFVILGFVGGFVSSYVLPQLAYAVAKDAKELFRKNFKELDIPCAVIDSAFFITYSYQIQRFSRNLIEDPQNHINYIPLLTNLAGGLIFQARSEYKEMEELTNGKH